MSLRRGRSRTAPSRIGLGLTLAVTLSVAIGGGAALAYWRTTGSGSGAASAGPVSDVTVVAVTTGTPSSKLIPGGTADLLIQISNPNIYAVTLFSISQNGSGSATGCTNAGSTATVPTQTGLNITIPAGSNQLVHVPSGIAMTTAAATDCQGATLHVPVTISVRK